MQKQTLTLIAMTLVGFSALAAPKTVAIKCVSNPEVYQAQFEATTILTVKDDNTVSGTVTYSTQPNVKAPFSSATSIALSGTFTDFPAGDQYVQETESYQLTTGAKPYTVIDFNTGTKSAFTSRLMVDGVGPYISDCEVQP